MKEKIGVGLGVFFPPVQQSRFIIKIYRVASWAIHGSQHKVLCLACEIMGLATGTALPGYTEGHYRKTPCTNTITAVL